jgi:hypothetical protein
MNATFTFEAGAFEKGTIAMKKFRFDVPRLVSKGEVIFQV